MSQQKGFPLYSDDCLGVQQNGFPLSGKIVKHNFPASFNLTSVT